MAQNNTVELDVDEDFQSTSSIISYGRQICKEDLMNVVKKRMQEFEDYEF